MVMLQRCGGRQDQVGMAGGFIDIQVHRQHEVQPLQSPLQLPPVGRGEYRVAGHANQRPHLAVTWAENLLGQRRHRQLARVFGQPGHPALPAIEMPARGHPYQIECRLGTQGATDPIEVAGEQVEQLDQPLTQAAENLGGNTHAAVAHRPLSRGEVARQLAQSAFGNPAALR